MLQRIYKFLHRNSQKGQGIVEYALILAFVAAIAAYAFSSSSLDLKGRIQTLFSSAKDNIDSAAGTAQQGGGGQSNP